MERITYRTRTGAEQAYYKYSEVDIQKANGINIAELSRRMGYDIKDMNQRWAEIKGQGGLSIDKAGNRWYCHSTGKGGGPIQLVMYMEEIDWQSAMEELLLGVHDYTPYHPDPVLKEPDKSNFVLPEKNSDYKHLYAYLIKTRLIHPNIIDEFVKKGLLYENIKRSCVFVGKDKEGKPRYANIRSTNTIGNPFKGDAALSDKRFNFAREGTGDTLTVVEAPIDLLSYMTIFKIHGLSRVIETEHILSLGGVSDVALKQYLTDHPEIKNIKLGLDNDEVGNKACEDLFQKYSGQYKLKRIFFQQKDFNEVLNKDIDEMKARNQERVTENVKTDIHTSLEELEPA